MDSVGTELIAAVGFLAYWAIGFWYLDANSAWSQRANGFAPTDVGRRRIPREPWVADGRGVLRGLFSRAADPETERLRRVTLRRLLVGLAYIPAYLALLLAAVIVGADVRRAFAVNPFVLWVTAIAIWAFGLGVAELVAQAYRFGTEQPVARRRIVTPMIAGSIALSALALEYAWLAVR